MARRRAAPPSTTALLVPPPVAHLCGRQGQWAARGNSLATRLGFNPRRRPVQAFACAEISYSLPARQEVGWEFGGGERPTSVNCGQSGKHELRPEPQLCQLVAAVSRGILVTMGAVIRLPE